MELEGASDPVGRAPIFRYALAVAGVLFLYTGLDNYLFLAHGGPTPTLYVVAFVAATAALAILNLNRPSALLRSPVLAWGCSFLVLTTAWGLWVASDPEAVQVIYDRYRAMALLLAFAVLVDDTRTRRAATVVIAVAVAGVALLNVAELAGVVQLDLRRIAGRAAGFYINPNRSGLAIALGLAVSAPVLPARWRLPLVLVAAAGVAATFSRGAALCFTAVVISLVWQRTLRPRSTILVLSAAAVLVALSTGRLMSFLDSKGVLNEDTLGRLRLAADDSGRTDLAAKAWRMFADSPLVGHGLGATRLWDTALSSHNLYLDLAASQGVLGLLLLPALVGAIVLAQRRVSSCAVTLLVAGVFTHNLLNEPYVVLAIAISALRVPAPARSPPQPQMSSAPAALET
jgi:O-antigen ligase